MGLDRIAYIKEKYSVLEYARDVLGFAVQKNGDRCVSFAPNSHNKTALVVYDDSWYDFKQGCGGDVIDLCAGVKYDGDKGAAIRELAGDYGINVNWKEYTQQLGDKIAFFHSQLRESDYHYLSRRGIKKETINRLSIGYDAKEDRLIIPYWKNGYVAYYVGRDRSGNPEASKYKKAHIDGLNENIAWGLHTFAAKRREEILSGITEEWKRKLLEEVIVIAEGAFDALSFEQEGFKVLSPISGYFNKHAKKQVIDMCKTAKYVFVCFDSDNAGTRFTLDQCKTLFASRIKFVCGVLPEGIKDVSEYYENKGDLFELIKNARLGIDVLAERITDSDEFEEFVRKAGRFTKKADMILFAKRVKQFDPDWLKMILHEVLKMPSERTIIEEITGKYNLKYVEGLGFYEYRHGVWIKRPDNAIKGYFSDALGQYSNGGKLESLLKFLKAETTTEELFNRKPLFNFRNCVLELETGITRDHSPADMSSIQVNYDYNVEAKCELWMKFISEIMVNREPSIKLLQEMTGYILFTDCSLQKCFFLMGDGSNGKSVFLNTIKAVFDEANVSNVEMSGLIEPFQRINLINSLVNISTETSSNIKGAESVFKQIVVGDSITGCYKNKDFVNFNPRCVMISACNEFIKSRDTTSAFLRRIMFIDFPQKFEGEKADINLEKKLKQELPGIFNWTYEGYKRLKEQKRFTETPEQNNLMNEFRRMLNPLISFIEEEMSVRTGEISRDTLYTIYSNWAKNAGHEAQSRTKFIRNFRETIKQIFPSVKEYKREGERGFDFSNKYLEVTEF